MNNKKLILTSILSLFLVLIVNAQNTDLRGLRKFTEIISYDGVSVQLVPSNKNEIKVSGENTNNIITQVSGTTLKIKMEFGSKFKGSDYHAIVYYDENLTLVKATEGSSITSNKKIKTNNLKISAIEGADVDLEVKSDNLDISVATGAKMKLKGNTENIKLTINAGGNFNGKLLECEYGEVSIRAGGVASVNVKKVLDASVTMGGTIYYHKRAKTINTDISLGGKILPRG